MLRKLQPTLIPIAFERINHSTSSQHFYAAQVIKMQCWWRMLQCKIRFATPAKLKIVSDRKLFQMVFKEWLRLCRMTIIKKVASKDGKHIFEFSLFSMFSYICIYISLSILSIYQLVYLSVRLSICLPVSLFACLSIFSFWSLT